MAIQFVGARRIQGNNSTVTGFTVPAGTQAGDFLMAWAICRGAPAGYPWVAGTFTDKGFAEDYKYNNDGGQGNFAAFSKFATSGDLSASWQFAATDDGGGRTLEMVMVAYRNVVAKTIVVTDPTTYEYGASIGGQDEATKMLIPALTGADSTLGSWVHGTMGGYNQGYSHSGADSTFSGGTERVDFMTTSSPYATMVGDDIQVKALNSYARPGWIDNFIPDNSSTFTNGFAGHRLVSYGLQETPPNSAPNAPGNRFPANGAFTGTASVTLAADYSDPDGNSGGIFFRLGTAPGTANVVDVYVASANGGRPTHTANLAQNTTYYFQPVSQDSAGVQTWGPETSFTTNRPPGAPGAFISPTSASREDRTGTVSVNAATDPDGQALQYEWDLSLNGGSTWATKRALSSGTSWTYDYTNELAVSTAMWRVRAHDGQVYSTYTNSQQFAIDHGGYTLAMMI